MYIFRFIKKKAFLFFFLQRHRTGQAGEVMEASGHVRVEVGLIFVKEL